VRTRHPVLKRGGLYWDRELLPRAVFDERYRRIQSAIRASGDDAWLVYGDAQRYGDVAYVTHFLTRLRSALALIPKAGDPVLLANVGLRDIPASKTLTWVEDMRPFSLLPRETVKLIAERDLSAGRIGLVGTRESLPIAEWEAIAGELPGVTWSERDASFRALRAHKEPAELDAMARATSIVETGLQLAGEVLRPGTSVRSACALIDRAMRVASAEDVRILIAAGPQCGVALRPPYDHILEDGEEVMLFVGAEVQRYWAEGAQTYVLGTVSPALRALMEKAAAALDAMQGAIRGGAPPDDVAGAGERVLGDEPLRRSARSYGLGHGIGLDVEEPPSNTFALHVVLHAGGLGAAAGRTIVQ
jgi:Xaa-Pro dipeptidase